MNGQLDLSLRGHRSGLISVSDLVRRVRDALDASLGESWVVGEVSNARLAPSNHLYFTLKDSRSAINVVMFKTAFQRMRFKIVDGMEVIVRGRVAGRLRSVEAPPRSRGSVRPSAQAPDSLPAAPDWNRDRPRRRRPARHAANSVRSIPRYARDLPA